MNFFLSRLTGRMPVLRLSVFLTMTILLMAAINLHHAESSAANDYQPNAIVLKLRAGANLSVITRQAMGIPVIDQALVAAQVTSIRQAIPHSQKARDPFGLRRVYVVEFATAIDHAQMSARLSALPEVEYAEPYVIPVITEVTPNQTTEQLVVPDDPSYYLQYFLPLIDAPQAWDIDQGDPGVVIAVTDNGTDWQHNDLLANAWTNPGEIAGNGLDDDGNGYIDDVHGYDVYANDGDPSPVGDTHGTHVAGLMSAVTDNALGIASVGWSCRIMSVRTGAGNSLSRAYEGIYYAAHAGADIINCSWSSNSASRFNNEVVQDAYAEGALVVAAGGNDNRNELNFPAAYERVIAVASTGASDTHSGFSNFGEWIDVASPGESIYSTMPGNNYGYKSGTSMATPITAGLCGLIKAHFPDWNIDQVAAQLILTADNIDALNPNYIGLLGSGRINAYRALTETHDAIIQTNILISDTVNGNNDAGIDPGETIDLYLSLRSLFSGMSNVNAQLSATDPYLTMITNTASYGNIGEGETVANTTPYRFTVSQSLPYGHVIYFELTITADSYMSTEHFYILVPPVIGNHDSGDITFTVTSDGELGFWQALNTSGLGDGFVFPADSGQNAMFSGSFVAGTGLNYVVDAFFNDGQERSNEWRVDEDNDGFLFFDNTEAIPQRSRSVFNDSGHLQPKGLRVRQENWSFDTDPDRSYVVLAYELTNTHPTNTISGLYVGIIVDWDIGEDSGNDEAGVDVGRKLVWQRGNDNDVYVGTALFAAEPAANLSVLDNATYIYPNSDLPDNIMFQFLSGSVSFPTSPDQDDYSTVCSAGPFSIAPGQVRTVAFAMLAANNLNQLQANADAANLKINDLLSLESTDPLSNDRFHLAPNWPNPFQTSTRIAFHLPLAGPTELTIYNIAGQRVKTVFDQPLAAGDHVYAWDGRNDGGQDIADGVYLFTLKNNGQSQTRRLLLLSR